MLARSAVGPASSVTGGVGLGQSASPSSGGQTSGPSLIRSFATKHPLASSGLTCRPRLLPMPTSGQSVAEALQAMELRWVASMQPRSRGTARLSSETSASLPAWMTPSHTPRMHWSDRQQQRQEQHQQQMQQQPAPQLPWDRAAADDIIDVLEACCSYPQQTQWRHIWEMASASYLDRILWWRLLHGSLMCGAYRAYIGRAMPAQLPFFLLCRPQSTSDHQPLGHHKPGCSHSHRLAMPPLASYDRVCAYGPSCQLVGGKHTI